MKKKEILERYELMQKMERYYQKVMTLQDCPIVTGYAYKSEEAPESYRVLDFDVEERRFIIRAYGQEIEKIRETLKAMGVEDA